MKTATDVDVQSHFADYLRDCEREPVVITGRGQPKTTLVAVPEDEEERWRFLLSPTPAFWGRCEQAAQRSVKRAAFHMTSSWKE
ncbi:MAG: hypothetical protein COZ06_21825 [Armatimonadetes bacterium CG_4_10_14_3_um_filter_66_18]|nr:type II toxin-antitoxin system Phd/YefM family antitoxin [Armatimonadota bacterium]OIP12026.1 MAG: hypothetical protein AUJ96_01085 [Armatimonadetes bacterium CG2_30_66_41]PIX48048.1 MAG: hypothetical protein COZ57_06600 [Armatimonadetes bacterium CG_4_8_14_3_um_filter_66_20]PIY43896.1 MAG: hypothetical protein COZ06_21825 [Armatimonadetes bacterium CG_4_10_14_3_um_filter_66_18]PIZ35398.1 MAG: hypothetical protein COY42_26850 [Armatimonadetes bacterium CG_4_10_14_0_8_um_filter_66_14]